MRVDHVVPYIGDEASGPAYSVLQGCRSLADIGVDVALHALAPCPHIPGVAVHAYPRNNWPHPSLGRSPEMLAGLKQAAPQCDLIHNHSLWMLNNIYPLWAMAGTRCKLVCSPHGTMAPWAWRRSAGKKQIMRWLGQQANLEATVLFQATSEGECRDIRALGFRQPIALVPNGIGLPDLPPPAVKERKVALFLGRLHPVKGIDVLLAAWARVAGRHPDWELHIVGPDSTAAYTQQLKSWIADNRVPRVRFLGPLFADDKVRAYQQAQVLVLPSHTENFGMVVAEALANGTPVIATRGTPWQDLETHRCGWWIDQGEAALQQALDSALRLPLPELAGMGLRGRDWMVRDFGWEGIAHKLNAAYEWVLHGGDRPACVFVD